VAHLAFTRLNAGSDTASIASAIQLAQSVHSTERNLSGLAYCQFGGCVPLLIRAPLGPSQPTSPTWGARAGKEVNRMTKLFLKLYNREEGQTLTEYALILSLVSVASIAFLTPLSDAINGVFSNVTGAL
jgi:Flp pilus assembly pilin Flp